MFVKLGAKILEEIMDLEDKVRWIRDILKLPPSATPIEPIDGHFRQHRCT